MGIFTAEGLLKAMGIQPEDTQRLTQMLAGAPHEIASFKEGFRQAVVHFNAKLIAIETQNAEILTLLRAQEARRLSDEQPSFSLNGAHSNGQH